MHAYTCVCRYLFCKTKWLPFSGGGGPQFKNPSSNTATVICSGADTSFCIHRDFGRIREMKDKGWASFCAPRCNLHITMCKLVQICLWVGPLFQNKSESGDGCRLCISLQKKKRRRRKKRIRWMCLCLCAYACATHVHALIHNIGGTLLATAWLQDSYFFYKAIKMVLRCNFEPNFSPFRIQTFNPVPPMTQNNIYIICGLQSCHVSS